MSEKQTSTESSHDEQTTKDSDGEPKQDPSELTPYDVYPPADTSELLTYDEMFKKQTSTESNHDEQTTKDSDGERKQDPSELPPYDDDDDMSKKRTSTESSHDEQTTKDSDGELLQDPREVPPYDNEMSKKRTSTESSHDEQTTKDSDGELKQDPSELPPYDDNDDDDMSKKRTSTESSHDEQTTKDSDGELKQVVFQNEEDNTKREILASLSDTTLEDLPMELIVCILVKAVAMEVKGMGLAKSVWKEKADLVISRLRTVSLQWSSVFSIDFFRNELHRTLDGFAQETLHLEVVLHQPPIPSYIYNLTTMGDEVFMIFTQHDGRYVLNVYDRNNVEKPKDVLPIPEFIRGHTYMAACRVSNCIYILSEDRLNGFSLIRVRKDKHQFKASTWIRHLILPASEGCVDSKGLSVSAQGNLIIVSKPQKPTPTVVGIYDANGFALHKITLSSDVYAPTYVSNVIQKADGNLVVSCRDDDEGNLKLLEIDTSGRIMRENQSSHFEDGVECFEDIYGRILVNDCGYRIELLDSEFNLMDTAFPLLDARGSYNSLHYDSERHEMVGFRFYFDSSTCTKSCVFHTIRFTEE